MSENESGQIYRIEVTYQDSGLTLEMEMDEWRDRIEEDLASFDAIKDFYRTDFEDWQESISEEAEEISPEESPASSGIVISNPPKEWKEDFGRAAPYLRIIEEQMVRWALFSLVEKEVESQQDLLNSGRFKPLIIRQSAFLEAYLELQSQLAFQRQKDGTLSSNEMSMIERMGHRDRVRLAHLFGVIDEEEHGHLQSMARLRNKLSHSPWNDFDSDEEANIEATAESVLHILESKIQEAHNSVEQNELQVSEDEFDIGFSGLDTATQLLQLSILDVLSSQDGEIPLEQLETAVPQDSEEVRQRCLRMDQIGYLDLDKEKKIVSLEKEGMRLLREENYID